MKEKHKYDNRGSLEIGNKAEELFDKMARRKGYIVVEATLEQDMYDHFDRIIRNVKDKNNIKSYVVEIKGMKRISAEDLHVQDKWAWIELHGVRQEDMGWLYGRAQYIVFERQDKFIWVGRDLLKDLVLNLVDHNALVTEPEEAEYKLYRRRETDRQFERTSLVELDKIEEIKCAEWIKPGKHTILQYWN